MEEEGGSDGTREETEEQTPMNDYEKRRQSRISENRRRLEALGLPALASSLLASTPPSKRRRRSSGGKNPAAGKGATADDDYRPSDDSAVDDSDDGEDDTPSSSRSRGKEKKKIPLCKAALSKLPHAKQNSCEDDSLDDEAALEKAIQLSLAELGTNPADLPSGCSESFQADGNKTGPLGKMNNQNKRVSAKKPLAKKLNKSRIQLTEDEVIAMFFTFDETVKGYITARDVRRMAMSHDFHWTDNEIAKMVYCFGSDGSGKIGLDEFRTIMSRCNMLQEP